MITPVRANNFIKFKSKITPQQKKVSGITQRPAYDTFVKQTDREEYEAHLKRNPKTAFMYDKRYTFDQRVDLVEEHPEIKLIWALEDDNGLAHGTLKLDDFFEIEELTITNHRPRCYIDTDIEINKKNLDIILQNKERIMTRKEFDKLTKYIKNEFDIDLSDTEPEYLELYSKEDGKLTQSPLIYLTDSKESRPIINAKKIGRLTPYFNMIVSNTKKPIYVEVEELAKLGYGKPSEIMRLLANKEIAGGRKKISEENGKPQYKYYIDISKSDSENKLKALRNNRCLELSDAENAFGLTKSELESAYLEGNLDCYTDAVFLGEVDRIFIDMKSPKNRNTFNRLLFEKEIFNGLNIDNFYKPKTSQRIKLAWYLAKNTRKKAAELSYKNPKIRQIVSKQKKDEFDNEFYYNKTQFEVLNSSITKEDKKIVKKFYEQMWEETGFEEFNSALVEADKLLKQAAQLGINSIQDEYLKNIISRAHNTSMRDFLTLP